MRKTLITLGIVLLIVIVIYSWFKGAYNDLVVKNQATSKAWSFVQSQYQRRTDMYSAVINTIQSSADFEKSTLQAVIEARSKATAVSVNLDPSKLTPENLQQYQQAQNNLSSSFSRLLVVMEKYPELKTTDAYRDFQTDQVGTENRINKARDDFSTAVQDYNTAIKSFPAILYAGSFGFKEKAYFKAADGADTKIPGFPTKENNPEVKQ